MAPAKQQENMTAMSSITAIPIPTYFTRLMLRFHQSSKAFSHPTLKAALCGQTCGLLRQHVDGIVMSLLT